MTALDFGCEESVVKLNAVTDALVVHRPICLQCFIWLWLKFDPAHSLDLGICKPELELTITQPLCYPFRCSWWFGLPRTRLQLGNRAFCVAGPVAWNSLPLDIRSAPTLSIFKICSRHLFSRSYSTD